VVYSANGTHVSYPTAGERGFDETAQGPRWRTRPWALPGGTMDLGERIAETVVREVREETGLDVKVAGIVGVYSDPGHVIAYSDGEVRQEFNLCFAARLVGDQLSVSDESTEVRWVAPRVIEALPVHESIRLRIKHFLERRPTPAIA
jgi:ADP-ribose pyrophosphatase YjhB (NUDIX family)